MLVNVELLAALEAAGVDREKAGAAAAILADYDRRLRRIERLRVFGRSRSRPIKPSLFNIELLRALGSVGVDPAIATAAAIALGEYEWRLRRIERIIETARWGAPMLAAQGVAFVLLLVLVVIRSFSLG